VKLVLKTAGLTKIEYQQYIYRFSLNGKYENELGREISTGCLHLLEKRFKNPTKTCGQNRINGRNHNKNQISMKKEKNNNWLLY